MTYPAQQKSAAQALVVEMEEKLQKVEQGKLSATLEQREEWKADASAARAKAESIPDGATSVMGLSEPLIGMRNPGLISIPAGFLLVVVFFILFPSRRSAALWAETLVRRETGIGAVEVVSH